MKLVKMLSLAAIAAIAAMAFVDTSSAFAKEYVLLCKQPELDCKDPWPSPVTIVAHATNPKLLTSIGTIECEKSLIELTLLQEKLEKLQIAHILSLSLEGNCHLGSTKCTVTTTELGAISLTHGPNLLEWRFILVPLPLAETSMNTVTNVKCGFFINCTYEGGEETEATGAAGVEGDITIIFNKAPRNRSAGFCPEVSELDATYLTLAGNLWLES